ncbi:MAG: hypothetical protein HYV08_04980 [Deltaproteobacteria bacterium]|nr:hypothetical protein [Deltaproteobacteria bacterium]
MKTASRERPLTAVSEALLDLMDAGLRAGVEMFEAMGRPMGTLMGRRTGPCSCEIPPPCWVPQSLGEVVSHVRPCSTASVRFRITNCGTVSRTITAQAVGASGQITVAPASLTLGPMERGHVTASLAIPDDAQPGTTHEALLWVRGCKEHYLRWTVKVGSRGGDSCHEVEVEDCPDLIHHWYDHFYCERPCPHQGPDKPLTPAGVKTHG